MNCFLSKILVQIVLYGLIAMGAFAIVPHAEAATLPATCTGMPAIENFNPYIYEDGVLHSFEYFVVGGGQAAAVSTVVGDRTLEPHYTTIWKTGLPNITKIHVDVPSWYGYSGDTLIEVKVMTATAENCGAGGTFVAHLPLRRVHKVASASQTSANSGTNPSVISQILNKQVKEHKATKEGLFGGALHGKERPAGQCRSWPTSVWIVITILGIAALLVIVDSLPFLLAEDGRKFALALLIIFLLSLGLWFLFDQCRAHRWFPIAITLLVLGTLIMPTVLSDKKRG